MPKETKIIFDYSDLIGRIIARFGSRKAFAEAYGISEVAMSKKLNGHTGISTEDIMKMSANELLDICPEDIHRYFFKIKVQSNWTKGD